MEKIFWFVVAFGILVGIHEWGHYIVARKLKVGVRVFAIGMGPSIIQWVSKKSGIQYALKLLPLGGYVQFLESSELTEKEKEFYELYAKEVLDTAFDVQPVAKRAAIVAAGPIMNFVLAFFALFLVSIVGKHELKPELIDVRPNSAAYEAGFQTGDYITSVDGRNVLSAMEVATATASRVGEKFNVTVNRNGQEKTLELNLQEFTLDRNQTQFPTLQFGLYFPSSITTIIDEVEKDGPAAKAGMRPGDEVIKIDGVDITYFSELSEKVSQSKGNEMVFTVLSNGETKDLTLKSKLNESSGVYLIGIAVKPNQNIDDNYILNRGGFVESIAYGTEKTFHYTEMTLLFIKRLILGDINFNMISGPVGIAGAAESTAAMGFASFMTFIALLSVNLGIMNLLPIPALDGGHLAFYAIEGIRGKPLQENTQGYLIKGAIVLLMTFMACALYVDIIYS